MRRRQCSRLRFPSNGRDFPRGHGPRCYPRGVSQPIFVGDVQGCADELETLVDRAEATFGDAFELWMVGDVVNRGPANLRALQRVRELVAAGRGHYVLGNHELNLLRVAAGAAELGPLDTISDVLEAPDADEWIEWLRRRPLAIVGEIGSRSFVLVHASVPPGERGADRRVVDLASPDAVHSSQ